MGWIFLSEVRQCKVHKVKEEQKMSDQTARKQRKYPDELSLKFDEKWVLDE